MPDARPTGRERILREATRLFAQLGVAGTSVQAVADAAGLRKASLLYHFESKEQLREAVLVELLAGWKDVLPRLLLAGQTGKDRLHSVLGEVLRFFDEDPNRARLLLRECLDRPQEMRAALRSQMGPWMGLMTGFIERGREGGRIHADLDPEAFITEMVVLLVSHFALGDVGTAAAASHDDPEWEQRRLGELVRVVRTSLFRVRTSPPPETP
ncbi:MAG: TetR/AcrR family transcriptional regulator [Proteobacteria bacterium]|nr:TetR/AcrR family transcriptional regulator [Pseudomonadota bacterium]